MNKILNEFIFVKLIFLTKFFFSFFVLFNNEFRIKYNKIIDIYVRVIIKIMFLGNKNGYNGFVDWVLLMCIEF